MSSLWQRAWQSFVLRSFTSQASRAQKRKRPRRSAGLESLEPRTLMAADLRTFDGTGNNLARPQWGSTDEDFLRRSIAEYGDGISTPAGADRVSARVVSNALAAQGDADLTNNRDMSAFVYAWGQFLDHDIDLTLSASPAESFPIVIPTGDTSFDPASTGAKFMSLVRSAFDSATGTSTSNPRQQVNTITAFIDGSQIYGSDATTAASLRTLEGGHLKTSAGNLLPMTDGTTGPASFLAGDIRVNENAELIAMQTLFMREHNRLADQLKAAHPTWNDEQLYQQARRLVIGELQQITYNEFLPALIGANAIAPYRGYNPNVNPGIANEFATAAFRLGHSMLGDDIEFLDNNGNEVRDEVALRDAFFNPGLIQSAGIDTIMKYLASDRAQEIDTKVIDDVRNFLFGPPGAGGLDLASLNIQRGRDHGLADYNAVRLAYGLPAVRSFADITKDVTTQQALQQAYGDVNNIDLWVGGLAEDHVPGASVGPLFQRIIADQFQRLRDGDRFWYERDLAGPDLKMVKDTSLADVIRNNTTTQNLQENVFFFHADITGRLTADPPPANSTNRNMPAPPPILLAGIVVQLQDASGNVLAETKTNADGSYRFNQLDLGTYRVRILLPGGLQQTSANPADVALTRGDQPTKVDFRIARSATSPPQTTPTMPMPIDPQAPTQNPTQAPRSPQQPPPPPAPQRRS